MMKEQSTDFITGYVFSNMENKIFKNIEIGETKTFKGKVQVPKVWFGLKCDKYDWNKISDESKELYEKTLIDKLRNLLPNHHYFMVNIYPKEQYMIFEFQIKRKPIKKMTLKQIEEKLGYEIELIS